jgi:hypothetical protein
MEQVPHWLEVTVFAAGMTAYAEEVDRLSAYGIAVEGEPAAAPSTPPDAIH